MYLLIMTESKQHFRLLKAFQNRKKPGVALSGNLLLKETLQTPLWQYNCLFLFLT